MTDSNESLQDQYLRITKEGANITTKEQAIETSLFKWESIFTAIQNLQKLFDVYCGFCYLNKNRSTDKCDICPPKVRKLCNMILEQSTEPFEELEEMALKAVNFFTSYKLKETEGEEE